MTAWKATRRATHMSRSEASVTKLLRLLSTGLDKRRSGCDDAPDAFESVRRSMSWVLGRRLNLLGTSLDRLRRATSELARWFSLDVREVGVSRSTVLSIEAPRVRAFRSSLLLLLLARLAAGLSLSLCKKCLKRASFPACCDADSLTDMSSRVQHVHCRAYSHSGGC